MPPLSMISCTLKGMNTARLVRVAAGGKDRLNAMYMVDGYGENNPIVVKSQFIMSLVERIDPKPPYSGR